MPFQIGTKNGDRSNTLKIFIVGTRSCVQLHIITDGLKFQGHLDTSLSELGEKQAVKVIIKKYY